jgi:hypothetical protein
VKVLVRAIPDDFRGELDCVQFISPVKLVLLEDNSGDGDLFAVICDGVFVAELREWLGKGRMRGCSGHELVARPGHKIVWEYPEDDWEDDDWED